MQTDLPESRSISAYLKYQHVAIPDFSGGRTKKMVAWFTGVSGQKYQLRSFKIKTQIIWQGKFASFEISLANSCLFHRECVLSWYVMLEMFLQELLWEESEENS